MKRGCPGSAAALESELPFAEMEALLAAAMPALLNRVRQKAAATVATLDRTRVEALLPLAAPRKGGGAGRLRQILHDEFLPFTRDYRHPLHLGHQRPAPSFASWFADIAAAAFNPTVTMFEGGPYSVAVEGRVLGWMKQLAGYPAEAVATLVNGGAEANLTALLVARDAALARGVARDRLRVLAGEHAHYTIARSLHVLGLDSEALVRIASRDDLAMDMDDLARQGARVVAEDRCVMAIVAVAGSTANGAFDDLAALRRIADAHQAWLHVDAAHGGAALLAPDLAPLVAGIAAADSLVINPHKMFFVSSPCSVLLCRRRAAFAASLGIGLETADYVIPDPAALAMQSDGDEPLRWTLACTRFFSAFRLYAAISAYGLDGIAMRVERCCALARHLAAVLSATDDFEILAPPAFNMVCFRYQPQGVADGDQLNRILRRELAAGPQAYLTGCTAKGRYWLRAQIMGDQVSEEALASLPDLLRRMARDIPSFPQPAE
jgi:L-2,4-diaminobutyrate decarboxylase